MASDEEFEFYISLLMWGFLVVQIVSDFAYMCHWGYAMSIIFKRMLNPYKPRNKNNHGIVLRAFGIHTPFFYGGWIMNLIMAGSMWIATATTSESNWVAINSAKVVLFYIVLPAIIIMVDFTTIHIRRNKISLDKDFDELAESQRQYQLGRFARGLYKELISPSARGVVTVTVEVSLERTEWRAVLNTPLPTSALPALNYHMQDYSLMVVLVGTQSDDAHTSELFIRPLDTVKMNRFVVAE
jgi:hypothetical protein